MLAMSSRVPDDGDPVGIQRNGIHLEGYLFKKSPAGLPGMHRWQRRYFRLQDRNLLYFEKQQHALTSTKALGVIDLANVSEIQWLSDKKNGSSVLQRDLRCVFRIQICIAARLDMLQDVGSISAYLLRVVQCCWSPSLPRLVRSSSLRTIALRLHCC